MGEPGAALMTPGSREVNLPGGVNLTPGGCEGSDDSHQGESCESRVTPTSLPSSEILGEGGASVKGTEQPPVVWVRYVEKGKEPVIVKLRGDPFEVCEQVRKRMFPGVALPAFDPEFAALMEARRGAA